MAKTDFEIRSILDATITADVFAWRDAAVATVAAERDAVLAKLSEIETELADPSPTVAKVKAAAERTELQRKKQAIRDNINRLNAEKASQQAELDALNANGGGAGK